MFGGLVRPGIDSRWNSHVSIGKIIHDLLDLPPLGAPRLDQAPSLADLIDAKASSPPPPVYGTTITQPAAPSPRPTPSPLPSQPPGGSAPVGPVLLRNGTALPPPNDQPLN